MYVSRFLCICRYIKKCVPFKITAEILYTVLHTILQIGHFKKTQVLKPTTGRTALQASLTRGCSVDWWKANELRVSAQNKEKASRTRQQLFFYMGSWSLLSSPILKKGGLFFSRLTSFFMATRWISRVRSGITKLCQFIPARTWYRI